MVTPLAPFRHHGAHDTGMLGRALVFVIYATSGIGLTVMFCVVFFMFVKTCCGDVLEASQTRRQRQRQLATEDDSGSEESETEEGRVLHAVARRRLLHTQIEQAEQRVARMRSSAAFAEERDQLIRIHREQTAAAEDLNAVQDATGGYSINHLSAVGAAAYDATMLASK